MTLALERNVVSAAQQSEKSFFHRKQYNFSKCIHNEFNMNNLIWQVKYGNVIYTHTHTHICQSVKRIAYDGFLSIYTTCTSTYQITSAEYMGFCTFISTNSFILLRIHLSWWGILNFTHFKIRSSHIAKIFYPIVFVDYNRACL